MFRLLKTRSDVGCAIGFYMSNSLFKICQAHFQTFCGLSYLSIFDLTIVKDILWYFVEIFLSDHNFWAFLKCFVFSNLIFTAESDGEEPPPTATISDFVRLGLLSLKNKYLINV